MGVVNSDQPHRSVLIVDDNVDLAESLGWLLRYYGCEVEIAQNGYEGLRKAIAGRPDIILIDIAMPGMTGYEVAKALREQLSYPAILIAQTAYGTAEDRGKALEHGFDEHVIKPVEPSYLIQQVAGVSAS